MLNRIRRLWVILALLLIAGCAHATADDTGKQARIDTDRRLDQDLVDGYRRKFATFPETTIWRIHHDDWHRYAIEEPEFRDCCVIYLGLNGEKVMLSGKEVRVEKVPARIVRGEPMCWEEFSSDIGWVRQRVEQEERAAARRAARQGATE